MSFAQRITRIKGLSDRRRLPRLGVIRLGLKALSKGGKEYPKETSYFVVPEEVAKEYGNEPTELDIMFPIDDIDAIFPTAYKHYGSSRGLKCSGDGEKAYQVDPETRNLQEIACPCGLLEQGKCKQTGTLMVMLPKVSVGGIYQITTSSFNSIVDINSGIDFVSALTSKDGISPGPFAMLPLKLRRVKTDTHHEGKKQVHYTLQITTSWNLEQLSEIRERKIVGQIEYQVPEPLDTNPELDPVDIIDEEDEGKGPVEEIKEVFAGDEGQSDETEDKQAKFDALTKIQATMVKLWPSKTTSKDRKAKNDFLQAVFGTQVWTEVTNKPLRELNDVIKVLDDFERNYTAGAPVDAVWQRTIMGTEPVTEQEEIFPKPEPDKVTKAFLASVDVIVEELIMSLGKENAEQAIKKALNSYEAKSFEGVKKAEHGAFITHLSGLKDKT